MEVVSDRLFWSSADDVSEGYGIMISIPDNAYAFGYENDFYLSAQPSPIAKLLAHYELLKMAGKVPGAIVECGVFKGASFSYLAMIRSLYPDLASKQMIGFDVFGSFPETQHELDREKRAAFIEEAGSESIGVDQLLEVLRHKGCDQDVELIAGDICETVPQFVKDNPDFRIAFLNLDTDIYEPAVVILEHLYPRIVPGGVLVLDDYGVFPGETKAVDDYFAGQELQIRRFPFRETPCYVIRGQ